jgi:excisionase family DNA binding protein
MVNGNQSPIDPLVEAIAQRTAELLRRDLGLESKRLMNVAEAAKYLDRSPHAIRHLIAKGELPKVQRGDNRVFLDRQDLDRWIEFGKTQE